MKTIVLGANGRTGVNVLHAALRKCMNVTAVVRSTARRPDICNDRLGVAVGDPCDPVFLRQIFREQDTVISTLGGRRPTRAATSVYFRSAEAIVKAAVEARAEAGPKRVLVTSTALLFPRQPLMGAILRVAFPNVARSAARMERILQVSDLEWTVARCGFLYDGEEAGYRAEPDSLPPKGTSVSRRGLAQFLVDAVERPATHRTVFGVSCPSA